MSFIILNFTLHSQMQYVINVWGDHLLTPSIPTIFRWCCCLLWLFWEQLLLVLMMVFRRVWVKYTSEIWPYYISFIWHYVLYFVASRKCRSVEHTGSTSRGGYLLNFSIAFYSTCSIYWYCSLQYRSKLNHWLVPTIEEGHMPPWLQSFAIWTLQVLMHSLIHLRRYKAW